MIKIENEPAPEPTNKSSELYFLLANTLVEWVKEDLKKNKGVNHEDSVPVSREGYVVISKDLVDQINKIAFCWGWTINKVDMNSQKQATLDKSMDTLLDGELAVMQNVPKENSSVWGQKL